MILNFKGVPCPKCGRKGLHYAAHPHAFGWKDFDHVDCRFCKRTFSTQKVEEYVEKLGATR